MKKNERNKNGNKGDGRKVRRKKGEEKKGKSPNSHFSTQMHSSRQIAYERLTCKI